MSLNIYCRRSLKFLENAYYFVSLFLQLCFLNFLGLFWGVPRTAVLNVCAAFSLWTVQDLPYSWEQWRVHTNCLSRIWEGIIFLWGNEASTPGITPDPELCVFMRLWIIIIPLDFCLLGQKVPSLTWKVQASKYSLFVIFCVNCKLAGLLRVRPRVFKTGTQWIFRKILICSFMLLSKSYHENFILLVM